MRDILKARALGRANIECKVHRRIETYTSFDGDTQMVPFFS